MGALPTRWNLMALALFFGILAVQSWQIRVLRIERDAALVRIGEQVAALAGVEAVLADERARARRNEAALTRRLVAERERARHLNDMLGRISRHEDRPVSELLRETMR